MSDVSFVLNTFDNGSVTWRSRFIWQKTVWGVKNGGGVKP